MDEIKVRSLRRTDTKEVLELVVESLREGFFFNIFLLDNLLTLDILPFNPNSTAGEIAGISEFQSKYLKNLKEDEEFKDLEKTYVSPGGAFWVLESKGKIVACVGLKMMDSKRGMVKRVCVDINHRRKGIGTRIMEITEEFARERGLEELHLDCLTTYQVPRTLYEKVGYEIVGKELLEIEGLKSEIYLMKKKL